MEKTENAIDAVRLMRDIRERLGRELSQMSFDEQRRYIQEHLSLPQSKDSIGA